MPRPVSCSCCMSAARAASCPGSRASIVRGPNECPPSSSSWSRREGFPRPMCAHACVLAMTPQFLRLPPPTQPHVSKLGVCLSLTVGLGLPASEASAADIQGSREGDISPQLIDGVARRPVGKVKNERPPRIDHVKNDYEQESPSVFRRLRDISWCHFRRIWGLSPSSSSSFREKFESNKARQKRGKRDRRR